MDDAIEMIPYDQDESRAEWRERLPEIETGRAFQMTVWTARGDLVGKFGGNLTDLLAVIREGAAPSEPTEQVAP